MAVSVRCLSALWLSMPLNVLLAASCQSSVIWTRTAEPSFTSASWRANS